MPDEDIPDCCFDEWAARNAKRARNRETAAAMGIPARVHESSDDFDRVCFVDDPLDLLLGSLIELYELEDVSFFASFVTKATDGPRQPEIFHAGCIHLASLTQTDPHSLCGQKLVRSLRRGSGYEQAKAKLRCIESDEVAVALGPPA